jgi:EAL domain-containing protein (putative c-di-GMP-specific phosphodiesterase class I)
MDAAWLSHADGDRALIEAVDGDSASFGVVPGTTINNAATYFPLVLSGELPNLIPDVRRNERAARLPVTRDMGAVAYAAVPVFERDGSFYGMLAAVAHDPRPGLQERDGRFLRLAAEVATDCVSDLRLVWKRQRGFWDRVSTIIDTGGPSMVFQPITDLAGRRHRIVGVEALARFPTAADEPAEPAPAHRPDIAVGEDDVGAMLAATRAGRTGPCAGVDHPPGDTERWFACAAAVGLGTELELAAVRAALAQLPRVPPAVFMSINISASTCGAELVELISGVEPRRILLEITEHSRLEEDSAAFRLLAEVRRRGVRIGADDVGAGYANLSQLVTLRPDLVKMDRYLTHGIDTDPARRAIASALVQVADEIGAAVLAEGVETAGELATLRATRVRLGQGNHIARPAPLPAVAPDDLWEIWAGRPPA